MIFLLFGINFDTVNLLAEILYLRVDLAYNSTWIDDMAFFHDHPVRDHRLFKKQVINALELLVCCKVPNIVHCFVSPFAGFTAFIHFPS